MPTHTASLLIQLTGTGAAMFWFGKLYSDIGGKFMWVANGELFLTGYRIGDFTLGGRISKAFYWKKGIASWNITGDIMNSSLHSGTTVGGATILSGTII